MQGLPNLVVFLFPLLKKKWKTLKKVFAQPHPQTPNLSVPERAVVRPEELPLDAENGETPPSETSDEKIANTVFSSFNPHTVRFHPYVQHLSSSIPESDPEASYTHPEMYMVAARKNAQVQFSIKLERGA